MSAVALLSKLDKAKQTRAGMWIARCPSHADRSPSLSIRELEDGRVLLKCFAGCAVEEILNAAGLTFDALFPERPLADQVKGERRPFNAHDVLKALRDEIDVAAIFCSDVYHCRGLADQDYQRFQLSCARIREAEMLANGERR